MRNSGLKYIGQRVLLPPLRSKHGALTIRPPLCPATCVNLVTGAIVGANSSAHAGRHSNDPHGRGRLWLYVHQPANYSVLYIRRFNLCRQRAALCTMTGKADGRRPRPGPNLWCSYVSLQDDSLSPCEGSVDVLDSV